MIVLSGASASGKTEVAKVLASKYGIVKAITTTTREMRVGEVDGRDYFFISKEQFIQDLKDAKFVEYTEYNGNFYGSTKAEVRSNKCVVIDPVGLKSYVALGDPSVITFFLDCGEEIRHQRMIGRGDKLDDVERRIVKDRVVFDKGMVKDVVDYFIDSSFDTIEMIADKIYKIYQEELNNKNM